MVRLIGVESSKTVHQFSTGDQESNVTCLTWSSNLTKRQDIASSRRDQASWERFIDTDASLSKQRTSLDLPRDLSLIDIEASLPKLSVLGAGGVA